MIPDVHVKSSLKELSKLKLFAAVASFKPALKSVLFKNQLRTRRKIQNSNNIPKSDTLTTIATYNVNDKWKVYVKLDSFVKNFKFNYIPKQRAFPVNATYEVLKVSNDHPTYL